MKNIVLVGFMGTGKTAVGKQLAKKLDMRYVNTDNLIEAREDMPINEIFAKKGEPHFRKIEKEVVKDVAAAGGQVIATGGGVVLDNENMDNLKNNGVIICLNATPEDILKRTRSYADRPLLNVPDPLAKIKELLSAREPYYKKADHQIDTSGKSVREVVGEVVRKAELA